MTPSEVAKVAESLTEAQREAVAALSGPTLGGDYPKLNGSGWLGPFRSPAYVRLIDVGLAERNYWAGRRWRRNPVAAGYRYRLTPLGEAVRDYLRRTG